MQRHHTYDDPFRRRERKPRTEAAVRRFSGIEAAPWDTRGPKEGWTQQERHGAAGLRAVRAVLWLTMLGAAVALLVGVWRVFLAG